MIERYTTPEMDALWSDETKFSLMWDVEQAFIEAQEAHGRVPPNLGRAMALKKPTVINVEEIRWLERATRHETAAFVDYCRGLVPAGSSYIHAGLTSSDVLDTALCVQLQSVGALLEDELYALDLELRRKAVQHRSSVILGRTHGQAAEPVTLGLKLLVLQETVNAAQNRLLCARTELAVGKLAGPVGTFSSVDPAVERDALAVLGLDPVLGTQVIPRDLFTHFALAVIEAAAIVENIALQIRLLAQTGIGEVSEGFGVLQKGSSSMPHKRNPIGSEQITGICRMIRSHAPMFLENVALWGERDMSHSSVERVGLADITTLLHYACRSMTALVQGLVFHPTQAWMNLAEADWGTSYLFRRMLEIGVDYNLAYAVTQNRPSIDQLQQLGLTAADLSAAKDSRTYLHNIEHVFVRALGADYEVEYGRK